MDSVKENLLFEVYRFLPTSKKRNMRVSFDEIALTIDVDENASNEEIKQIATRTLMDNLFDLVQGKATIELLPEDTLNENDVFLGQLIVPTTSDYAGKIGVITRICRQVKKPLYVQFEDGTKHNYNYYEVKGLKEYNDVLKFKYTPYSRDMIIKNNTIYKVSTMKHKGLAVININYNLKDRLTVHIINADKKTVEFMTIEEFKTFLK